ncbi:MAG: glycosyltransferase [Chloroflexota bacterium]
MTFKLAIFLPGLYGGGAERAMLNLADGFAQRGLQVDLVVGVADGPLLEQIPESVHYVPLNVKRTLLVLPALIRYLQSERPDTLLTALNRANLAAIWAKQLSGISTRLVISERNTIVSGQQQVSNLAERVYPFLGRLFYPQADGIVAVSQSVAEDVVRMMRVKSGLITVIENPIITPSLRQRAAEPLDHPWFGPAQPPVILSAGRLSKQKDMSTLIRAFAQTRSQTPARLMLLGEGPERPQLEALIHELDLNDEVLMPGWVPNPIAYMREAALFILCSRWEGLPGVLIEALYTGVPVIGTDAPGGTSEVLKDGLYGRLVPVGCVSRMAKVMEEMLSHPAQGAPPESWQPYELEQVLDRYEVVLRS